MKWNKKAKKNRKKIGNSESLSVADYSELNALMCLLSFCRGVFHTFESGTSRIDLEINWRVFRFDNKTTNKKTKTIIDGCPPWMGATFNLSQHWRGCDRYEKRRTLALAFPNLFSGYRKANRKANLKIYEFHNRIASQWNPSIRQSVFLAGISNCNNDTFKKINKPIINYTILIRLAQCSYFLGIIFFK